MTAVAYDARNDVVYQTHVDISMLAQMMVRFDEWIDQAKKREAWGEVGELQARRLAIQQRRSALMVDAWRRR